MLFGVCCYRELEDGRGIDMETLLLVALVAFAVWFVVFKKGNLSFWNVVKAHPTEAWEFVNSRPEWHIGRRPQDRSVTGPMKLMNPSSGEYINVYCDSDTIDASQADFMKRF
jgi:hypothetical protein